MVATNNGFNKFSNQFSLNFKEKIFIVVGRHTILLYNEYITLKSNLYDIVFKISEFIKFRCKNTYSGTILN